MRWRNTSKTSLEFRCYPNLKWYDDRWASAVRRRSGNGASQSEAKESWIPVCFRWEIDSLPKPDLVLRGQQVP